VVVSDSRAVEIDDGTFENNTADGVRLEGAPDTTIRGAQLLDNGRDGLLVANGSDRTLVTGVAARGNARHGLSVIASNDVRIVDSRAETSGDSGLGVGTPQSDRTATARNVSVENTSALDNGEHGVEIDDSAVDATLVATNASDNVVDGIHVDGADGVTMSDTTTLGNGRWALFTAGTTGSYSVDGLAASGGDVSFTARNVAVRDVSTPSAAPPSGHAGVGIYVNATQIGPNPFFDASISYDQSAVDAAGIDESTLRLWEFDGSTWTEVTGSTVDTVANTVSANVTAFSVFALFGTDGSEPAPTPTPASAPAATGGSGDGDANEPPVAAFDVSTDAAETDAAIRFDASGSDDSDGIIVSYEWDFDGDGQVDTTSETPRVSHAFPTADTYEVSLTVVDGFGATNTTTRTVEVEPGATPTPTPTPTATETETPTPTATATETDTVTPTGNGISSPTPATTLFGSSFPWWLLVVGILAAGAALYVARRRRDGRQ
jgi:PKD repeat protein